MFRFIHAADLHLDTPFEGVSQAAPEIGAALRDASLNAWDRLVDLALKEEAAFVVLAGDVYDGVSRGIRAQIRFLTGLQKLSRAGIKAFIAHGNHDPINGWSAIREWPKGVRVFSADSPEEIPVEHDGRLIAVVHGISFGHPDVKENLALSFRRGTSPGRDDSALHVGVLHCNVGSNPAHEAYAPCSIDDLVAAKMDYWALGHIHQRQFIREGNPWIVYPGNTQGRSPRESEAGAKGAVVVEAEGSWVKDVRFVPLDEIRFGSVTEDISGSCDLSALVEALFSSASRLLAQSDGRSLILTAQLEGNGPLHNELARQGALPELLGALRDRARSERLPLWWDRLNDGTAPEFDREAMRSRGDLQSEIVRLVDALFSDPELLEKFYARNAAALDDSICVRFLKGVDPQSKREILREAERLALESL